MSFLLVVANYSLASATFICLDVAKVLRHYATIDFLYLLCYYDAVRSSDRHPPHIDTRLEGAIVARTRTSRRTRTARRPIRPTAVPVFSPGWLKFLTGLSIAMAWGNGTYHLMMGDTPTGIFMAAIQPPIVIMGLSWFITAALLNPTSQRKS